MDDPTYDRKVINCNPVWDLAYFMSEAMNDNAPIGWSRYICTAKYILDHFDVKRKCSNDFPSS